MIVMNLYRALHKKGDFAVLNSKTSHGKKISWNGKSTTVHVSNRSPETNRAIEFGLAIVGVKNTEKKFVPQITTNPEINFDIIEQVGPVFYRPHLAGAYIVDDEVNPMGRNAWPLDIDLQFVPEFVTEYRFLITLAPHDGVDIVINLVPAEDDS